MDNKFKLTSITLLSLCGLLLSSCVSGGGPSPSQFFHVPLYYAFDSEEPSPHFRFAIGEVQNDAFYPSPLTNRATLMLLECWVDWPLLQEKLDLKADEKPSLELNRVLYDEDGNKLEEGRISSFGDPSLFPDSGHFDPGSSFSVSALASDMLFFEETGDAPTYIEYGVVLVAGEKEAKPSSLLPGTVMDTRFLRVKEGDISFGYRLEFVSGIGGETLKMTYPHSFMLTFDTPKICPPFVYDEEQK